MLKAMRSEWNKLKWILWVVVAIFVAFIFFSWGMGGMGTGKSVNSEVARVGSHTISAVDFDRRFRQTEERYRQMYKQQWSPSLRKALDLPRQVLNSMVDRELAADAARESGLSVSDEELAEKIRTNPSFQKNGEFIGASAYSGLLAANGYNIDQFEREYRQDLLIEKFNRLVAAGLVVPDSAVAAQYARQNEKAKIQYVLLAPDKLGVSVAAPTDAELLDYFQKNKEKFRQPERRKIKYLLVDEARLREKMKPTPGEIGAYYEAHRSEFPAAERVHAAHVLVKTDQNATAEKDAEALKKAQAVLARARKGEDFAALARQTSDDPGSKDKGGDLGTFARGQMVKPFEDAAFSMAPGEIRGPVKSDFGYHVIKLLEKVPAGIQSLQEATPRITAALTMNTLKEASSRRAQSLAAALGARPSDEKMRKSTDDVVTFNATDWITTKDVVPGFGYSPDVLNAAFMLKTGEVSTKPITTPKGPVILKVDDIKAPGLPDFAEVKAQVTAQFRADRTSQKALEAANALKGDLSQGGLEAVAKKSGVLVQSPDEFAKSGTIAALGSAGPLVEKVFTTPANQFGGPVWIGPRGVVFFKVLSRTQVDPTAFGTQKEKIRDQIRQQEAQRLIESVLERRRAERKVVVEESALERYSQG
jgi:peptidyl-prolyl cis-trans isomerase D